MSTATCAPWWQLARQHLHVATPTVRHTSSPFFFSFFFRAQRQNKSHQPLAKNAAQGANPRTDGRPAPQSMKGTSQSAPCATLNSSNEVAFAAERNQEFLSNATAMLALHVSGGVAGEIWPSPTGPKRNWFRQTRALQLPQPGQPDGPNSKDPRLRAASRTTPSLLGAPSRGVPSQCITHTNVVSTAN